MKLKLILVLHIMILSFPIFSKVDVLFLNSYHHGYKWSDDLYDGFYKTLSDFNDGNISIHLEFMNTKKEFNKDLYKDLSKLYKKKYRNIKFSAIITSDNNALNFIYKYRNKVFGKVPVFFAVDNYFNLEQAKGFKLLTGVSEKADIKSNLDLILNLHPNTKKIIFITDNTTTGQLIFNEFQKIKPLYDKKINFVVYMNHTMEEVTENMKKLKEGDIVFYTLFFRDKKGGVFSTSESAKIISENSPVPVYGAWEFSLGHGIVGGKLASGYYQGEMAANLLIQMLSGVDISQIPVVYQSPNKYMFDHQVTRKFSINKKNIPENSVIINYKISLWESYKNEMLFTVLIFILLLIIIIFLSMHLIKKKKN